jgi:hypothetical protein
VSKQWGGLGRDYLSYALAIEVIGRASATVAASLVVTNSLVAELVEHAGTDGQRERWLRSLAAGQTIGAFALSEPNAGTDAANQQTTAVRTAGGYLLTGRKVWVAMGRVTEADDDELACAYYCANVPAADAQSRPYRRDVYNRAYNAKAMTLYRRHHIDKLVKMVALPAGINPTGRLSGLASAALWHVMKLRAASANARFKTA